MKDVEQRGQTNDKLARVIGYSVFILIACTFGLAVATVTITIPFIPEMVQSVLGWAILVLALIELILLTLKHRTL